MKTRKLLVRALYSAAFSLFATAMQANNLQISGTSVDTTTGEVTFNIKWDNSWRTNIAPANHDAVWVFIKYQDCTDKLWKHANLSVTSADHSAASPLKVDAVTDGKGAFVYRSANGGGNIGNTSVTLKLNIAGANYANLNFKVFGVEMVNIPQGSFTVGDGASTSAFTQYTVLNENALTSSTIGTGNAAPAAFPKGYKAFYSMKYEITQEQYVDFLNTLTYGQQARRSVASPDGAVGTFAFANTYRNGIKIKVPGNNAAVPAVYGCDLTANDFDDLNDGQNIAMNHLSWGDLTAYLDWAALRPMTEMEFEKITRGPLAPVANEYAWGTTTLNGFTAAMLQNANSPNEGLSVVASGRANYGLCSGWGAGGTYSNPVKVGFTATASSGRESAAAAYYGVMEMSGNAVELAISAKTAGGSTFTGVLGDGQLSTTTATDGDSDQANWPDNTGAIERGGGFFVACGTVFNNTNSSTLRISDRSSGALGAARSLNYGGRGVR
ncbi:formylglycine-generating enzyme family protein [Chryseobacterium suipulveris]|uniref:Formylglycine-generating enzyme family protein n=1 Tax=Chryseobacterium suipulveris TaxID=2929800 RepID=A0ABY4BPW7_9FLAO|nr:SUMF1/EgtB/PvdO family nonheme iron enzyme [Chryseobacterium suipulveris]UOE39763.1 formylglycine-generating enzyme family protein [Chryseobacterium suipulveris]